MKKSIAFLIIFSLLLVGISTTNIEPHGGGILPDPIESRINNIHYYV